MKNIYGTSVPAPETVSEIARLSREAYEQNPQLQTPVEVLTVDRRGFLGTMFSAGALVLGASLTGCSGSRNNLSSSGAWQPSVYLGFEPDGKIVVTAHRSEMGTGSRTSLPLVIADELDVDWKTIRVEQAVGDKKYGSQNTDGSCSVRVFVAAMHQTGATARTMLERAAAQKWGVPAGEVKMKMGMLTHSPQPVPVRRAGSS
jgi:isoquinoline 1-oxidoreductase beta subunit